MGFGGISPLSLLLILAIIVLLFGTRKLRNIGGDLGNAIKNFKNAMTSGEANKDAASRDERKLENGRIIDAEIETKDKTKV